MSPENERIVASFPAKRAGSLNVLILALLGGLALAYAIVVPPLQVSDEHAHFVRAYLISRGEFVGHGFPDLPAPVAAFVMRYPEAAEVFRKFSPREIAGDLPAQTVTAPESTVLSNYDRHHEFLLWSITGSATYCPLVYLPASLGIWTARALHLSPLMMMYGARIFNLLTLVMALAIALRLAPNYRAIITATAFIPMTLYQAGGISSDGVAIAVSYVGFGMVLHAREYFVGRRFLVLLAAVFALWSLSKFSIWALPLLFLLPVSSFKGRRAWLAYIGSVSIAMVLVLLIWGQICSDNTEAFRVARLIRGVDISANVRLVVAHPLVFARQLFDLAHTHYKSELAQFLGGFGWTRFALPLWVRAPYLLLLIFVAFTEFSAKPFLLWERGILLMVFLGGLIFVHAAIFVSDGRLCPGQLDRLCFAIPAGVQGRYFLPFCLAGFLILRQSRINLPQVTLLAVVLSIGTLHNLAALALLRSNFYF